MVALVDPISIALERVKGNTDIDLFDSNKISKALVDYNKRKSLSVSSKPRRGPKSFFAHPTMMHQAMGFKDRRFSVSFDLLRELSYSIGLIAAIHNKRVNQISQFTAPFNRTRQLGFAIRHKDRSKILTSHDKSKMQKVENIVSSCGVSSKNRLSDHRRPTFEAFTRMVIRDGLTYDQMSVEAIYDKMGRLYELYPIDASTIRIAANEDDLKIPGNNPNKNTLLMSYPIVAGSKLPGYYQNVSRNFKKIAYVQVVNNIIENMYNDDELIFGIRNPRSDLRINGYGFCEMEQMIGLLRSLISTEEYNKRFFSQASIPKGLFNIRGELLSDEQLNSFIKQLHAQTVGVTNVWRTPVVNCPDGVDWIPFQMGNKDMEYIRYLEYLIRLICAVYLIDPAEVNYDVSSPAAANPYFESQGDWKVKKSKDSGLRPMLSSYAGFLNENIIARIDPNLYLEFVGLDELSQKEQMEIRQQELTLYKTLNEVRADMNLPPVGDGDIILNPSYLQHQQLQIQREQFEYQQRVAEEQRKLAKEQQEKMEQQQQQQMQMAQQQQQMQAQQQGQQQPQQGQERKPENVAEKLERSLASKYFMDKVN